MLEAGSEAWLEARGLELRQSAIHGLGLFTRRTIRAGQRAIEYLGEIISKEESLRRCEGSNPYIFSVDETHDLDGNVAQNPARFINHSCACNCDAELAEGRIWIVARRFIGAGEELTFNYGYDLEAYREYPCTCGAVECVGYMVAEEFFPMLRRLHGA